MGEYRNIHIYICILQYMYNIPFFVSPWKVSGSCVIGAWIPFVLAFFGQVVKPGQHPAQRAFISFILFLLFFFWGGGGEGGWGTESPEACSFLRAFLGVPELHTLLRLVVVQLSSSGLRLTPPGRLLK